MDSLIPPKIVLFDWHATLVNTLSAMYKAMDKMLLQIEATGLVDRLVPIEQSKTVDDAKLVRYVKDRHRLHPKLKAEQKVSRTDILEVLFGADEEAKHQAHEIFKDCYRDHYGDVKPFQPGIPDIIQKIKAMDICVGIVTNRDREFLEHELDIIEGGTWKSLFEVIVCGDDSRWRKPNPEILIKAVEDFRSSPDLDIWYVGDSTTDISAAKRAGITGVFYNGANWKEHWLRRIFPGSPDHPYQPDSIVSDFTELYRLIRCCRKYAPDTQPCNERTIRALSRVAKAWQNTQQLTEPVVILFDWHATLVDTMDAMYHAVDDVLPQLETLGLIDRLIDPGLSKTVEDAKLVEYVRDRGQLHPKVKTARKISRTDIFEVLFGADEEAKKIAHNAFNRCYRNYFGKAYPFEPVVRDMLILLREMNLRIGVLSNRDREFLLHELNYIENGTWADLFDTVVGGDDTKNRKPAPDPILKAIANLDTIPGAHCWYVGDSTTDIIAAKKAGVTSVFYNGAKWEPDWVAKIFPGTKNHPHQPDYVVNDFNEFLELVKRHGALPYRDQT